MSPVNSTDSSATHGGSRRFLGDRSAVSEVSARRVHTYLMCNLIPPLYVGV